MTDMLAHVLDNPIFPAIGLALVATGCALWIAGAWWAYRDATWRTGSTVLGMTAAGWVLLSTPLLLPLSLGVYAFARPQLTAAQGRSTRLVEELVSQLDAADPGACPGCDATIDPDWLRCPRCSTWLAEPCARCGTWSARDLAICPWCGSEERDMPAVEVQKPAAAIEKPVAAIEKAVVATEKPAAAVETPRKPRRRQSRRKPVGVMASDTRQPRARLETVLDGRPPARAGSR